MKLSFCTALTSILCHFTLIGSWSNSVRMRHANRVQRGEVFGRRVWWWRDDVFSLPSSEIAGNKARKLEGLQRLLSNPGGHGFARLASYGGPQSNSMLALSVLARAHGVPFVYYSKKLPSFLSSNRLHSSNLERALRSGMDLRELTSAEYERLAAAPKTLVSPVPEPDEGLTCWVPQGGAFAGAEAGIEALTKEVADFVEAATGEEANRPWKFVVASGTGTMALFAARCMEQRASKDVAPRTSKRIEVVAVPCVSSGAALQREMAVLDAASGDRRIFPTVLDEAAGAPARVFSAPCAEHLGLWMQLKQQSPNIEFDLVYAPRAWEILRESQLWSGSSNIIYYCCGGHEGNESQLGRYRHLGLLAR